MHFALLTILAAAATTVSASPLDAPHALALRSVLDARVVTFTFPPECNSTCQITADYLVKCQTSASQCQGVCTPDNLKSVEDCATCNANSSGKTFDTSAMTKLKDACNGKGGAAPRMAAGSLAVVAIAVAASLSLA